LMIAVHDAVALAIEALSWMEYERLSERAAFSRAVRQLRISKPDELRTAQRLVLETTRRRNFIDYLLKKAIDVECDLDSLEYGLVSFLRLFCYWTKFRNISDQEILRILRAARSVLGWRDLHPIERMFGRILAVDLAEITAGLSSDQTLALYYFHPSWFVSASTFLLGRSGALNLLRRNLSPACSYVRINTLRGDEGTCLREIEKAGIEAQPVENLPFTLNVSSSKRPIIRTDPYRRGMITFQDKASILAAFSAAPKPGDLVLDLCAAPGGKTSHLAQLMQNSGTICAIDRSAARMALWRREMSRLGVEIAHPLLGDITKPLPANLLADVVVLDPPCSNTGTFWKTPSTKWRLRPDGVRRLSAIQSAMLQNASSHVREGGTLAYSTCSILPEENEQVVGRFLRINPEFEAVDSTPRIGLRGLWGLDSSQRLYPHLHECNGHFLSKMKRSR
jgi:16S rRNA (cytosine967-C5)-methyltransferase